MVIKLDVDEDALEQGLVEGAAVEVVCHLVEFSGSAEQVQDDRDSLPDDLLVQFTHRDQALGVRDFVLDGRLAWLQVFHGDGVHQVGVDQFLFLALQPEEPLSLGGGQVVIVRLSPVQLDADLFAYLGDVFRA